MNKKIIKIMNYHLEIPDRKIIYLISIPSLIKGLWMSLKNYGVPYTSKNHKLLLNLVQLKLEGPDVEREWSEKEYYNFVCYKD